MSANTVTANIEKYVLFELVNTTYAIQSNSVSRLEMVENVTPVPNSTHSLEGVVLSRGRIIPALNLRARFGFPKIPYDLRTRLIVVEDDSRLVGLIVDTAREFTSLSSADIKPAPEAISNLNGDYLEGIATPNDRVIFVLRLSEILKASEEISVENKENDGSVL